MRSRALHVLAAGAISALVVSTATTTADADVALRGQPDHYAVTGKAIYKHLKHLQRLADANDGNRAAGSDGYEASARYVETQLRKAGYSPQRQYFDIDIVNVLDFSLEVPGVALDGVPMSYSTSTPDEGVNAELVAPAQAEGCDAAAWNGVDAMGKIAVVSRGTCPFGDKALVAGQAGAVGTLIYNNGPGALNGTLGGYDEDRAPAVGIPQDQGKALLDAMASGPLTGSLDLQTEVKLDVPTFNVIAETAGGDPDNVVMVGAHLDSVADGPGINDNGSGAATILQTAIKLAGKPGKGNASKNPAINNKVRFAWWGAEELGLLGSTHYVDDLAANDPAALTDIAVYLNFDMVASPNYIIGVYDADESTYPAPVEVPAGSAEAEKMFTDYFDAQGQPWVDTEFSGRSDYQAFIENGVAATGLFTGADGVKTDDQVTLFGGTAGITYDPNYHSPEDDLSNVDRDALQINGDAIGVIVRELAKSTKKVNGRR